MFKVENFNHYFIITETKEEVTRQPQCTVKTSFSPTEMNKNDETKFFKLSQKNVCVETNMAKPRVNRLL